MAPWICTACTYENEGTGPKCAMCDVARTFTCARCAETIRAQGPRVMANGRAYHRECFSCAACHEPFTTPRFQLKDGDPYHLECYKTLFLPVCEVCEEHIPVNEAGNVVYKLVPFWDMKYCPSHDDRFRCCSCQRIEPLNPRKYFEVLSDGRKTCHDCAMTVVLDTNEAQSLVKDVWQFMESIGISLPYVRKLPLNSTQQCFVQRTAHSGYLGFRHRHSRKVRPPPPPSHSLSLSVFIAATMKDLSNVVCARVTDAPTVGGTKMYQVKISVKGKSKSMYKTKDDFKNVLNMFKLVGAMAARKGDDRCEVCASCSSMTVRTCDEEGLDEFLSSVLDRLRKAPREAIDECSSHRGVIQILMDFLSISKGKYFCDCDEAADPAAELLQENDLDHPIAHCSLHRSLSEQFAAMDSVC